MRGDNGRKTLMKDQEVGSPPHAWGQLFFLYYDKWGSGITPTCVGTTSLLRRNDTPRRDHPHMRGDNLRETTATEIAKGSPPHAWGQPAGIQ